MVGFCKYCGFVGTNEQMMGHAENCPPDGQPDTVEENGSSYNSAMDAISLALEFKRDHHPGAHHGHVMSEFIEWVRAKQHQ